jgi:putative membrane protein
MSFIAREAKLHPGLAVALQVVRGFCMGAADVVPGVSGGTVALVLGIYERLVDNVHRMASALGRLLKADSKGFLQGLRSVEWLFIVPLLGGIGLAVLTLAHAIEVALENHPVPMGGLFFGLVAASAVVAFRLVRRWGAEQVVVLVLVAVAAAAFLGLAAAPRVDPAIWVFLLAGMVAICAMILPGISGSFLLLMLGMYDAVLDAVNQRQLGLLAAFVVGCVIGLALFSSVLNWALEHHHDVVMAGLVGLMIGSLRVLWPWPEGTEEAGLAAPGDQAGLALLIALGAAAVVLVVSAVALTIDHEIKAELDAEPA